MSQKTLSWTDALSQGFEMPVITPGTLLPDAVGTVNRTVTEHILRSSSVRTYLEMLPKGPGQGCPDAPIDELVKYAATQQGEVQIDDSATTFALARDITRPRIRFTRNVLLYAISFSDATEIERRAFEISFRLAEAVDHLYLTWFERVVIPYKQATGHERVALVRDLPSYDYTVPTMENGTVVKRQTWMRAFPSQTLAIVRLSHELFELWRSAQSIELAEYFRFLGIAYACQRTDLLEREWSLVDEAWVKIPRTVRLVPVHGMESGYDHPVSVSPEFRLEVRTDRGQEQIPAFLHATLHAADAFGVSETSRPFLERKFANFDVGVFQKALESGACLTFSYSGQSVPNRQEIPGGKVFLVEPNDNIRGENAKKALARHCDKKTAEQMVPLITKEHRLLWNLGHECFHPVACTPDTDSALGEDRGTIEESKASLGGIFIMQTLRQGDEEHAALVADTLAYILLMLHPTERGSSTFQHYVTDAKIAATIMFESGIIALTEHGVTVHMEHFSRWIELVVDVLERMVHAYNEKDRRLVKAIREIFSSDTNAPLEWLISWIDKTC